MMTRTAARALAVILIVAAIGLAAFDIGSFILHLTDPAPLHINEHLHDAHVIIDADRTNVPFWTDCIGLSWQISGIKSLFLNGEGHPGVDSLSLCGSDASFALNFFDGATTTYDVSRDVVLAEPSNHVLILTFAAVLAWAGLWLLGRTRAAPLETAQGWLAHLFQPAAPDAGARGLTILVIGGLFVLGAAHWISFFNRGQVSLTSQDWALEQHYWEVMDRAFETGELPFFINGGTRNTDNFLGNPETTLTPFLLISPPLTRAEVALWTTLTVYALGCWGTLLLRRRYRLSLFTFTILFLLLNFNGFITSHIGVGHFMYLSTLLLPFFALCLLKLADGSVHQTRVGLQIGLVFFGMELLGGYNFLVWCGETLVLFLLCNRSSWRGVLIGAASGLALTAVRVLPAIMTFSNQPHPFLAGFPTLNVLFDSLTALQSVSFLNNMNGGLARVVYRGVPWWEFDMFVGALGLGFVLLGAALRFAPGERFKRLRYPGLDVPLLVMALLALGDFYKYVATLPIPLVNVDRNSSRILIVPLTILIVLAALRFDALLPTLAATWKRRLALLAGVWLLSAHLMLHSELWSLVEIERRRADPFVPLPSDVIIDVSRKTLGLGDRLYVLSVPVGLAITLVAILVWIWLYWRSGRGRMSPLRARNGHFDDAAPMRRAAES